MLPVLISIGEIARSSALGTLENSEGVGMLLIGGMASALMFSSLRRVNFKSALD
jgi:hypothetical protein